MLNCRNVDNVENDVENNKPRVDNIENNIIKPRGKPYTDADILDYVDEQRRKAESHFLQKNGICIDAFQCDSGSIELKKAAEFGTNITCSSKTLAVSFISVVGAFLW